MRPERVLVRRAPEQQQRARRVGDAAPGQGAVRDRRPRRRLGRCRRHERRPERRRGVAPGRLRRVQRQRRHAQPACTTRSRRRASPEVRRARPERPARARSTASPCSRWRSARRGGACGSTAAPSARRSTCPGSHGTWYPQAVARELGRRRPAPATPTPTASPTSRSRSTNGGSWKPLENSSVFQDTGYTVVADRGHARRLPRDEPLGRADRAQRIVSGVPTCISRASFRIDSFGMRMQPCETRPGGSAARSCRGRRRSRRRASRSASPSARSCRTRPARRTGCRSS